MDDKYEHLSAEYLKYLEDGYSQRYIDPNDLWYSYFELEDKYFN